MAGEVVKGNEIATIDVALVSIQTYEIDSEEINLVLDLEVSEELKNVLLLKDFCFIDKLSLSFEAYLDW